MLACQVHFVMLEDFFGESPRATTFSEGEPVPPLAYKHGGCDADRRGCSARSGYRPLTTFAVHRSAVLRFAVK